MLHLLQGKGFLLQTDDNKASLDVDSDNPVNRINLGHNLFNLPSKIHYEEAMEAADDNAETVVPGTDEVYNQKTTSTSNYNKENNEETNLETDTALEQSK